MGCMQFVASISLMETVNLYVPGLASDDRKNRVVTAQKSEPIR